MEARGPIERKLSHPYQYRAPGRLRLNQSFMLFVKAA
jgi:hypothetical protein